MLYKYRLEKILEGELDMALKRRALTLLGELAPGKEDNILDAGCGWGYYENLLIKAGFINYDVVAIDNDKISVDNIKRKLQNKRIKIVAGDIANIPFKENTFSKVILSEVLEHVDNDLLTLKEIKRVLKKGGTLFITVPNKNYPLFWDPVNWILERFFSTHIKSGFWRGIWANHLRLYTTNQIISKLKNVGFKITKVKTITTWCLPFNGYLLYGGKFPKSFSMNILKNINKPNKPLWAKVTLLFLNYLDKLNDIFPSKNVGVGIFIKAEK